MAKALEFELHSPSGAEPDIYTWPLTSSGRGAGNIDGTVELVETIRWVCKEFPDVVIESDIVCNYDKNSYESIKSLVEHYNNAVDVYLKQEKQMKYQDELSKDQCRSSRLLLRHILQQVYNRAVTNPNKLNQYKPFSPEVYGETSFDLICQIIEKVNISEEDTFLDLGSGVGQIVLQVAASTPCKMVWGIERSEWPNRYADKMDFHFKRLMRWWGKPYAKYQLIKGDFMDHRHSEKIRSASIIFTNNFAFGPILDQQLIERFSDLPNGTKIVSCKEFCPLRFKISDRNLSDIGAIMHVYQLSPLHRSVSWTGKSVVYYVHTIDRTKLELYFNAQKNQSKTAIYNKKNFSQTFQNDPSSNFLIPKPSDLVRPSLPILKSGLKSSLRTRTRRMCQKGEFITAIKSDAKKLVKTGVTANRNSAGKPIGRVGKRKGCQGIEKRNPILDLELPNSQTLLNKTSSNANDHFLKNPQLPCDISAVALSLQKYNPPTQSVADHETNITPSLRLHLDAYRDFMISTISMLKDREFRKKLIDEIEFQRELKKKRSLQITELDKEISYLIKVENKLHQQQRKIFRSRKLSQVNVDIAEISFVGKENVLREISLTMPFRKSSSCKVKLLPPENVATPCTRAQPKIPKSTCLHQSIENETMRSDPQVVIGYDLEDNLRNLIISVLKDNTFTQM